MQNQYRSTRQGFGMAYTITREDAGFTHHISGKAPGRDQRFLVERMLLLMAELTRQFQQSGIGDAVKFDVEESGLGTHHLNFRLTPEQQNALGALLQSSGARKEPAGTT